MAVIEMKMSINSILSSLSILSLEGGRNGTVWLKY